MSDSANIDHIYYNIYLLSGSITRRSQQPSGLFTQDSEEEEDGDLFSVSQDKASSKRPSLTKEPAMTQQKKVKLTDIGFQFKNYT